VRAGPNVGAGAFLKDYIANYKEHQTLLRPPRRPPRQEDRQPEDLTEEDLPGLRIIEDVIDMTMETTLMAYLEKQEWERETRRGKLHYGWKYVDASHTLERAEELPTELMNLIDNLMDAKDSEDIPLLAVQPNQVSVNDYEPGVGIGWHKDIDDLGDTITSISLMGATTMEFRKGNGPVVSVRVPRYSALQVTGELREQWQHQVPYRMSDLVDGAEVPRDRRVAVILRNVQCALDAEPDAETQDGSGQA
jgi:alkylated DNA repair dioxygenase AlkB